MKMLKGTLVAFTYSELQMMTNNFTERLGRGGFGSVFERMLPDSTPVAVKKLEGILQVEQQFRSKISTIGAIHHLNLICLPGFCSGCTKKLLVYEYTPKGSLDVQLFRSSSMALDYKVPNFSWNCKGVILSTRGMPDCISHYDIKRGKILSDASFVPKLADFGLGKLVGRDFSSILTKMRGTIGYLAPEWIPGGSITAKADVYGYGMMLEITSGRRNIEPLTMEKGKAYFLALLACNKVVEGDVIDLLDHRVEGDVNDEELDRMLKVASWCIQDDEGNTALYTPVPRFLQPPLQRTTQGP